MSSGKVASWAHGEEFVDETTLFSDDGVLARARERGNELGSTPVLPGAGALMRVLAAAVHARSAVEIGTGSGVGSLYLLSGMHPDGVLTTIDLELENQRAARGLRRGGHPLPGCGPSPGVPATWSGASPTMPTISSASPPMPRMRWICSSTPAACSARAECW